MLDPFRVVDPSTPEEAAGELARLGEGAWPYAGGAELLLLMRHGLVKPDVLVDLKGIPQLSVLREEGDSLVVGAVVTHDEIAGSDLSARSPALRAATAQLGNVRVRNQGTLGGNLCFADPHSDPPTALLLHGANVQVTGPNGSRTVAFGDFILGPYETALARDEVLTSVVVPALPEGWGSAFLRMERFHRPTANVAAAVRSRDGVLEEVRLAVGCIGPRPERLTALEEEMRGAPVGEVGGIVDRARPGLWERLDPVEDLLGPADYKIQLATVLLKRALLAAEGSGDGPGG